MGDLKERRDFAWRCLEDDPGFAMEKLDEIITELEQKNEQLRGALKETFVALDDMYSVTKDVMAETHSLLAKE